MDIIANRYKVIQKLGQGGMGVVFKVFDELEHRELALKLLSKTTHETVESFLQFKQEFWTMSKLAHPNTVNVYDYGIIDKNPYFTMEIVQGKELTEFIRPPFDFIYKTLVQLCQVLEFIHSRILIHCDIKPHNIRIKPDGTLKLMDFGLMNQLGMRSSGQITGTVAYLPPEMATGGIINASSDLYSVGVLAYELITGAVPFIGKTALDVIKAHINTPPPPLLKHRSDVPEKLNEIVLKLLAKDQQERYQRGAEVIADIRELSGIDMVLESVEQKKSYISTSMLIGRDKELKEVQNALEKVIKGQSQALFVAAPAGVGKSRLIQEFKLYAQLAEIPFLSGRCYEQGMTSYQPMVQALNRSLPLSNQEILDKYGPVLVKILPQLKDKHFENLASLDIMAEKVRLYDNINSYLKEISAKIPIIIFIDDLHWADLTSVEMLNSCIRELTKNRVLILGTLRDDEVPGHHPIWQTVEEGLSTVLKLSTFSKENITALIKAMLGKVMLNNEFIDQIASNTGGNAFFITEVMRFLVEEDRLKLYKGEWLLPDDLSTLKLPTSIGDTVVKRVEKLSEVAKEILNIAAVAGHKFDLNLFQKISGFKDNELFNALDELIEKQFLNKVEHEYIFPHDRVRETIYSRISSDKLQILHQKIAEVIEQENIGRLEPLFSELAYHYSRGTNKQKAVEYLIKAGETTYERMQASYLMKQGVDLLGKIDYPDKESLLLKTYEKLAWVSYMIAPGICLEVNEKLVKKLEEIGNVPLKKIHEHKCLTVSSYTMMGQNDKAYSITKEMLQKAEKDSIAYALALFGKLNAHLTTGKFRILVKEMEEVEAILGKHLDNLSKQLQWVFGFSSFIREDALAWLGEQVGNNKYSKNLENMAFKYNFLDLQFWSYYPDVVRNSLIGEYPKIKAIQPEVFTMIKRMGRPIQHENRFNVCLCFAAIEFGDMKEAKTMVEKIVELGSRLGNFQQQANGKLLQAMLCEEENNFEQAIKFYETSIDISRQAKIDQLIPALYHLANLYIKQNKYQEAKTLVNEAHNMVIGKEFENPYHQISTFRIKGLIAINDNNFEDAEKYFENSLETAKYTENLIQQAFTLSAYAKLYEPKEDYQKAKEFYDNSIKCFMKTNNTYQARKIKINLDNLAKKIKSNVKFATTGEPATQVGKNQAEEIGYRLLDLFSALRGTFTGVSSNTVTPEMTEKVEKVEKINRFGQLVLSSLDFKIVLNKILDQIIEITESDRGLLMLLNDDGELDSQVVRTRDGSQPKLLNFSRSFTEQVLKTRESLWVADAQADSRFASQASILAMDLRSILCVPLKMAKKIIGLIYMDRQAVTKIFTKEDLTLVESLAAFASIALINARLHNQAEEKNERLQMLNDLSKTISTTFSLDELLKMVLQFCLSITKAEIGYIFLGEDLKKACTLDNRGNSPDGVKVSRSVINNVKQNKSPLCSTDTSSDELLSKQASVMALDLKSIMCVPILAKDTFVGLVYVSSNAVNKCFTNKDLELMIAIIGQVGLAIDNLQLLEVQKKQEKLQRELEIAQSVQASMLPDYDPDVLTLDVSGYSCPAANLGGDYYDYFKISDSQLGLAVGDVNGHGITASLLMAMAKSCLFVQGQIDPNVIPVMTALNSMVYSGTKTRLFMTFIYSIFDIFNTTVTFASAGHHLPYHYKKVLSKLQPINLAPVYPLGVREKVKFKELTINLDPEDILVYYTDGIIEAKNTEGEEFGFERLEELIVNNAYMPAKELKELIVETYKEWIKTRELEEDIDDVTIVVAKVKPVVTDVPKQENIKQSKLKTGFLTLVGR